MVSVKYREKLPLVASLVALPMSEVNEALSGVFEPQFFPEAKPAMVLEN